MHNDINPDPYYGRGRIRGTQTNQHQTPTHAQPRDMRSTFLLLQRPAGLYRTVRQVSIPRISFAIVSLFRRYPYDTQGILLH